MKKEDFKVGVIVIRHSTLFKVERHAESDNIFTLQELDVNFKLILGKSISCLINDDVIDCETFFCGMYLNRTVNINEFKIVEC